MKRKLIGPILGIILVNIIGFLFEYSIWGSIATDAQLNYWADHYSFLIFLIIFLILTGILINFITKTNGIFEKFKEACIIGIISSFVCYAGLIIIGILPRYIGSKGSSLLKLSYSYPLIIFLPLFIGFISLGEILLFRKKDYEKQATVKIMFSIILVVLLIIIPVLINSSLANEKRELDADIYKDEIVNNIVFMSNSTAKEIFVATIIEPIDLSWSDFMIYPDSNSLPTGTVYVGDKIFDCSDTGYIIYIPNEQVIYQWDFTENE